MRKGLSHPSRRSSTDFRPHPALDEYREMPKHFSEPHNASRLIEIGTQLAIEKPYASYLYAAGWMFAEAAIIATESKPEERHTWINVAKECWESSKRTYVHSHEHIGESTSKLYTYPDRVQTSLLYIPLMHDMVNGYVYQDTCDTLHRRLIQLTEISLSAYQQLRDEGDSGTAGVRKGHLMELATLGGITRVKSPTLTMLPSLERSDDGSYRGDDTHDLVLLHMKKGVIGTLVPFEVKPRGGYGISGRNAAIILGNSHLKLPASDLNVFSYLEALVDEQKGKATRSQSRELNYVSQTIIAQSLRYRDQKYR